VLKADIALMQGKKIVQLSVKQEVHTERGHYRNCPPTT
jgi:hypothetical protein